MYRPRNRRRWTQFTLRAALLVILVVAAFLGGRASNQAELDRLRNEVDDLQTERLIRGTTERLRAAAKRVVGSGYAGLDEKNR